MGKYLDSILRAKQRDAEEFEKREASRLKYLSNTGGMDNQIGDFVATQLPEGTKISRAKHPSAVAATDAAFDQADPRRGMAGQFREDLVEVLSNPEFRGADPEQVFQGVARAHMRGREVDTHKYARKADSNMFGLAPKSVQKMGGYDQWLEGQRAGEDAVLQEEQSTSVAGLAGYTAVGAAFGALGGPVGALAGAGAGVVAYGVDKIAERVVQNSEWGRARQVKGEIDRTDLLEVIPGILAGGAVEQGLYRAMKKPVASMAGEVTERGLTIGQGKKSFALADEPAGIGYDNPGVAKPRSAYNTGYDKGTGTYTWEGVEVSKQGFAKRSTQQAQDNVAKSQRDWLKTQQEAGEATGEVVVAVQKAARRPNPENLIAVSEAEKVASKKMNQVLGASEDKMADLMLSKHGLDLSSPDVFFTNKLAKEKQDVLRKAAQVNDGVEGQVAQEAAEVQGRNAGGNEVLDQGAKGEVVEASLTPLGDEVAGQSLIKQSDLIKSGAIRGDATKLDQMLKTASGQSFADQSMALKGLLEWLDEGGHDAATLGTINKEIGKLWPKVQAHAKAEITTFKPEQMKLLTEQLDSGKAPYEVVNYILATSEVEKNLKSLAKKRLTDADVGVAREVNRALEGRGYEVVINDGTPAMASLLGPRIAGKAVTGSVVETVLKPFADELKVWTGKVGERNTTVAKSIQGFGKSSSNAPDVGGVLVSQQVVDAWAAAVSDPWTKQAINKEIVKAFADFTNGKADGTLVSLMRQIQKQVGEQTGYVDDLVPDAAEMKVAKVGKRVLTDDEVDAAFEVKQIKQTGKDLAIGPRKKVEAGVEAAPVGKVKGKVDEGLDLNTRPKLSDEEFASRNAMMEAFLAKKAAQHEEMLVASQPVMEVATELLAKGVGRSGDMTAKGLGAVVPLAGIPLVVAMSMLANPGEADAGIFSVALTAGAKGLKGVTKEVPFESSLKKFIAQDLGQIAKKFDGGMVPAKDINKEIQQGLYSKKYQFQEMAMTDVKGYVEQAMKEGRKVSIDELEEVRKIASLEVTAHNLVDEVAADSAVPTLFEGSKGRVIGYEVNSADNLFSNKELEALSPGLGKNNIGHVKLSELQDDTGAKVWAIGQVSTPWADAAGKLGYVLEFKQLRKLKDFVKRVNATEDVDNLQMMPRLEEEFVSITGGKFGNFVDRYKGGSVDLKGINLAPPIKSDLAKRMQLKYVIKQAETEGVSKLAFPLGDQVGKLGGSEGDVKFFAESAPEVLESLFGKGVAKVESVMGVDQLVLDLTNPTVASLTKNQWGLLATGGLAVGAASSMVPGTEGESDAGMLNASARSVSPETEVLTAGIGANFVKAFGSKLDDALRSLKEAGYVPEVVTEGQVKLAKQMKTITIKPSMNILNSAADDSWLRKTLKGVQGYFSPHYSAELHYTVEASPGVHVTHKLQGANSDTMNAFKVYENIKKMVPGMDKAGTAAAFKDVRETMKPLQEKYAEKVVSYSYYKATAGKMDEGIAKTQARISKMMEQEVSGAEKIKLKKLQDTLAERLKRSGEANAKLKEFEPGYNEYMKEWTQTMQKLASKHSSTRMTLAMEDTGFVKYPWLRELMTESEKAGVVHLKGMMDEFAERIKAVGGRPLKGDFVHHALHPDTDVAKIQKFYENLAGDNAAGIAFTKLHHRMNNSMQMMPELNWVMERYLPDVNKRIAMMDFWGKKGSGKWLDHRGSFQVKNNKALDQYWKTFEESFKPRDFSPLDELARKYTTFEAIRLLAMSPSVAIKHTIKVVSSLAQMPIGVSTAVAPQAMKTAAKLWAKDVLPEKFASGIKLDAIDAFVESQIKQQRMMESIADFLPVNMREQMGWGTVSGAMDRIADSSSALVKGSELFDRSMTVLAAMQYHAAKQGTTPHQAMYGMMKSILENNFLGGVQSPRWMTDPKVRAFLMFQGTPFKILERRLKIAYKSGKAVKKGTGTLLDQLQVLKQDMVTGERNFKMGLIADAFASEKDIYGSPYTSVAMKELLMMGAMVSGGSALLGNDLSGHAFHLPFVKANDRGDATLSMNPAMAALHRSITDKDSEPEFWLTEFFRDYFRGGPIPEMMKKSLRLSDGDIPEVYKTAAYPEMSYLFAIPGKGGH